MESYRIFLDVRKANDYTRGEIDGIIKASIEDSARINPWFILNDYADPMKRICATPEELGDIVNKIEKLCPHTIRRIECIW